MTLYEATVTGFRNYFVFKGRASRQAYWKFLLGILLVLILIIFLRGLAFGPSIEEEFVTKVASDGTSSTERRAILVYNGGTPGNLFFLFCVIPAVSAAVRRLHDTNRSGWWLCFPPIAFVVALFGAILVEIGPTAFITALRTTGNVEVQIRSGFGILLLLIVLASWITLQVWLCQRSTPGPNRFDRNSLEAQK